MGCPELPDGLIVPRLFTRVNAPEGESNEPRPLSSFLAESALVVLGEPGMGKTTSFIQAAREEADSECLTIRQFCPPRNPTGLEGKTLYLDGLDEQRAGKTNGNEVLDAIIGRLEGLGRPKFRLSCRTADWFGELDKSELRAASSSRAVTVIRLEPLNEEQIQEIVVARGLQGDKFLEQARQSGIDEWITNPQHLEMVLDVVSLGQAWPETRQELFERACTGLVREHSKPHRMASEASSPETLTLAAGLLCAVILRSDLDGIALDEESEEPIFPLLTRFPETGLPLAEAARTKLFRNPAPERAAYYHRTMAEYLAARFLVHQMANGLPVERVRRLLTTENGLVPSHLRGLHAWVATLCPEPTIALFLRTDPMGLVLYGDPAVFSASRKGDLLDSLAELAKENPWFRGGRWESDPLGRLADTALKDRFEAILSDWRNQPSHMLITILDIVHQGKFLTISQETLFAFICEHDVPANFRSQAVEAFIAHCPDSLVDLKTLLTGLEARPPKSDDNQELRAVLLNMLYPSHLTLEELEDFLIPPPDRFFGAYHTFLNRNYFGIRSFSTSGSRESFTQSRSAISYGF